MFLIYSPGGTNVYGARGVEFEGFWIGVGEWKL